MALLTEQLKSFVTTYFDSLWALELFLLLATQKDRTWSTAQLVRELRAAQHLVSAILRRFQDAGLVGGVELEQWKWQPATTELRLMSEQLVATYAVTPSAVVQIIARAHEQGLM